MSCPNSRVKTAIGGAGASVAAMQTTVHHYSKPDNSLVCRWLLSRQSHVLGVSWTAIQLTKGSVGG